jgi:capsular polysaccharide biosynthesis protein
VKKHFYEARDLQILSNVILEPKHGLIFTSSGSLVIESTPWGHLHAYNSFPWNRMAHVSKLRVSSAIYVTSNSYYHWLVEDLPSTIFCLQKFPDSPIIAYKNSAKYVMDFLSQVDAEVIFVEGPIQVGSLLCVTKRNDSGWPHPIDLQVLKAFEPFSNAMATPSNSQKVYVSRINSKRSPENEDEIIATFKDKGYLSVELEGLNLFRQIELISSANSLAGIHGAGLTNMIWMNHDSQVQDISNVNYWTECFHRIAHFNQQKYRAVTYEGAFKSRVDLKSLSHL